MARPTGRGTTASAANASARSHEHGEVLPFLILWPALIVLMLLLVVHAFIVTGARAQAETAASAGLRAAWHAIGDSGLEFVGRSTAHTGNDPHPRTRRMAQAAEDAVARSAAVGDGWRWWTPGATTVRSDWCHRGEQVNLLPGRHEPGWLRVEVTGEIFGPFSALWPGRLDRVHAVAAGPAVLAQPAASATIRPDTAATAELPVC